MNTMHDRRSAIRIKLSKIEAFFRQCDIAASSDKGELDITIIDISQKGMCLRINREKDQEKIDIKDQIFIRGCIFNNNIGFLSSQMAVTVWKDGELCGVEFTPELEFDEPELLGMLN